MRRAEPGSDTRGLSEQIVGVVLRLDHYHSDGFKRGRPYLFEALWWIAQACLVRSWIPGSLHRRLLLRLFGAEIGQNVTIKPGTRIKFPWRLKIGDHTWIGEDVWIDNLAPIKIGAHCCISQGAYLCTGSHKWNGPRFDLIVRPIEIEDSAWICARAIVAPGVIIKEGSVLAMGGVATTDLAPWGLYGGVPAKWMKARRLKEHAFDESPGRADGVPGCAPSRKEPCQSHESARPPLV